MKCKHSQSKSRESKYYILLFGARTLPFISVLFSFICCDSFQKTLDYWNHCGISQHMRFHSDMCEHGMCTSIVNPTGDWHSSYLIWNSCAALFVSWNAAISIKPIPMNQYNGRTCESELNRLIQCVDVKLNVNFHIGTLVSYRCCNLVRTFLDVSVCRERNKSINARAQKPQHTIGSHHFLSVCAYDFLVSIVICCFHYLR